MKIKDIEKSIEPFGLTADEAVNEMVENYIITQWRLGLTDVFPNSYSYSLTFRLTQDGEPDMVETSRGGLWDKTETLMVICTLLSYENKVGLPHVESILPTLPLVGKVNGINADLIYTDAGFIAWEELRRVYRFLTYINSPTTIITKV